MRRFTTCRSQARACLQRTQGAPTIVCRSYGTRLFWRDGWAKALSHLDAVSAFRAGGCMACAEFWRHGYSLGVRLEVTEAVLNRRAGIVGIYQRHDCQRRNALPLTLGLHTFSSLPTAGRSCECPTRGAGAQASPSSKQGTDHGLRAQAYVPEEKRTLEGGGALPAQSSKPKCQQRHARRQC